MIGPESATRIYEEWIQSCVEAWGDWIVLVEHQGRIAGFSVWKKPSATELRHNLSIGHYSIGAIHPDYFGRGLFKLLTLEGMRLLQGVADFIEGPTHVHNLPVQRGYLKPAGKSWTAGTLSTNGSGKARSAMIPPFAIPFNRSSLQGNELKYISETIAIGQIAGDQAFSRKCHALLEDVIGVQRALITTSCTHALEMAALLLDLQPGDEVIVPSFTFVSTANAFVLRGAKPVFCDSRPDTLNLDETKLAALITPRTRAIIPVHYAGVACEMDAIIALAARQGVVVIEDNAHGLFGKYKGRWLGTLGAMATQSFHETKNITCGEGGALLINDHRYAERAEIIREKGTNRARFFRGQIDKYSWVDLGSSYVMSDVLAAFLYAQLEVWPGIQARRKAIWNRYQLELAAWARTHGVRQPIIPEHCEQSWHMYYLLLPSLEARTMLIAHLKARGILAVFHYLPLHLSDFARRWGGQPSDCPVAEDVSDRLLRLPFFNAMTPAQQGEVIAAVQEFSCGA